MTQIVSMGDFAGIMITAGIPGYCLGRQPIPVDLIALFSSAPGKTG
jgi:hypothetical protein